MLQKHYLLGWCKSLADFVYPSCKALKPRPNEPWSGWAGNQPISMLVVATNSIGLTDLQSFHKRDMYGVRGGDLSNAYSTLQNKKNKEMSDLLINKLLVKGRWLYVAFIVKTIIWDKNVSFSFLFSNLEKMFLQKLAENSSCIMRHNTKKKLIFC